MQVGYVGLGNMGGALARRLQLSHPLIVFDLDADAVSSMVEAGATAASSLSALGEKCDIVLLCLPTSDFVRRVLFEGDGLAQGLRPGTIVIDQSTGDPVVTRQLQAQLAQIGVTLVDAPVSGGALGAEAGTISIMVGATEEDFAKVRPVLDAISCNVARAGNVGAGHVIKLVNNMISGAVRAVTIEGVALAAKNGIDPSVACDILLAGGGRSAFLEKFMAPHVVHGRLFTGFTLGLMHKDVRLACDLGAATGVPMFMGSQTREFYQMCISQNGAQAEVHSAAQVMDALAGTHVVPLQPDND